MFCNRCRSHPICEIFVRAEQFKALLFPSLIGKPSPLSKEEREKHNKPIIEDQEKISDLIMKYCRYKNV
jgi:hypothetical protein